MTYHVRHTTQYPITLWYSARSTLPVRTVVYRAIKAIKGFSVTDHKVGKIKIDGKWVLVWFRNGQWEAIRPIPPAGRILFAY